MGRAYTRAEMRDWVRERLGVTPPIAQPIGSPNFGPAGTQPAYAPNPNNHLIDSAIDEALSNINTRTGFHAFRFTVDVPATTLTMGPQKIKLSFNDPTETKNGDDITATIGIQNFNTVRRVLWIDGGGSGNLPQFLLPAPFRETDLAQQNFDAMPPSIPQYFFVDGYSLFLYPASANGGTLILWGGTGLQNPIGDTGIIDQLPADYYIDVLYNVMVTVGESRLLNTEMAQLAQSYTPKADRGVENIGAWQRTRESPKEQSNIGYVSNRNAYGLRRRRR